MRIVVDEDRRDRFYGHVAEVLRDPSSHRTTPRCPYYRECGGCDWQHISRDYQLQAKRRILLENLKRLGGIELTDREIQVESGSPWEYRGRVQIHGDENGHAGFKGRRSGEVVPVDRCVVARPVINETLAERIGLEPGSRVTIVETDSGVSTESGRHFAAGARSGSDLGSGAHAHARPDEPATRTVAGVPFDFDPGGFFQSNQEMLDRLVHRLGEILAGAGSATPPDGTAPPPGTATPAPTTTPAPAHILDLYAGAGVMAGAVVASYDASAAGVSTLAVTCVERDRRNARFIGTNLERAGVPAERIDVVRKSVESAVRAGGKPLVQHRDRTFLIADPPRGGLSPTVRRWIADEPFGTIAYVSCDAAALARDLKTLKEWYSIEEMRLYDFYPQTAHVETLVVLKPIQAPHA